MQVASFIVESHRKNKSVRLTWWGGEPLLEEKKIDCITEYLRDNNVRFSSNMITNGSLINDRIIRKMSDQWNMKLVQISFDSAEQEYIRRKQYYTYHNEYFTIMDRVNELSQTKVNVMIRCNVDMGNIPYAEEFIGDLKKQLQILRKYPYIFLLCINPERRMENASGKTSSGSIKLPDGKGSSIATILYRIVFAFITARATEQERWSLIRMDVCSDAKFVRKERRSEMYGTELWIRKNGTVTM